MDMLTGEQIARSGLTDWRKLAQGLHARYLVDDFTTGARFVAAVGAAGDTVGHHPHVSRNLWFGGINDDGTPRQRFHIEVYVAPESAAPGIAAAIAAGGTVVDDSGSPSLTVIADQDGNTGILCDASAARTA